MSTEKELFEQLIAAINSRGPDDNEARGLITKIQELCGDDAARDAEGIRNAWMRKYGKEPKKILAPATSTPQASEKPGGISLTSWPAILGILTLLGVGGGAGSAITQFTTTDMLNSANQFINQSEPIFRVANSWQLLGLVAATGSIAGLIFAFIRDGGLVAPRFKKETDTNKLIISQYGFLNEMFAGGLVAAFTSWTAAPTAVGMAIDVKIGTLVSAVLAGLTGANMRGAVLRNWFAKQGLAITATQSEKPAELKTEILGMSLPEAVKKATGLDVVGFESTAKPK